MTTPLLCIGDPNGIGPEISVGAALAIQRQGGLTPILVGDAVVVEHYASRVGALIHDIRLGGKMLPGTLPLLPVDALRPADFAPGRISPAAGHATVEYVRAALGAAQAGLATAIVAAPHSETAINAAGIEFAGYPSLLSALSDDGAPVFLLLVHDTLRISHATLHCSVREALDQLDEDLVESAIVATHRALQRLGVERPRLGVFGVNPHAGEGGLFGTEDIRIVVPAIQRTARNGIDVAGPTGCDVLLADRSRFDGFVAMFHDQGHAPVKLLGGRQTSALSIGLDVTFASVGHGAAFDIAGTGVADYRPVLGAIKLVSSMSI